MNRRRKHSSGLGPLAIMLTIIIAIVGAGAGVSHAYLKNRQLQVNREIAKAHGRVGDLEVDITTEGMRMAKLLDRYELRSKLDKIDSELIMIHSTQLEEIPFRSNTLSRPVALTDIP